MSVVGMYSGWEVEAINHSIIGRGEIEKFWFRPLSSRLERGVVEYEAFTRFAVKDDTAATCAYHPQAEC